MDGGSDFWAKRMPNVDVVITYDTDESFYIETTDGQQIAYANHDEDGWYGMAGIRDAIVNMAKAFGIEVREEGEPNV